MAVCGRTRGGGGCREGGEVVLEGRVDRDVVRRGVVSFVVWSGNVQCWVADGGPESGGRGGSGVFCD